MPDRKIKFYKHAARLSADRIKNAINDAELSIHEIASIVHMASKTVRRYVATLRDANEIYIANFRNEQRAHGRTFPVPLYSVGDKPDAVYKTPSKLHRDRKYRRRLKADPERYSKYLLNIRLSRIKPNAQPELAAFFGMTHR